MNKVLKFLLLLAATLQFSGSYAQVFKDETKWTFEAKKKSGQNYELIVHCKLPAGWHIFSFNPGGDGSLIAPKITFAPNAQMKLRGGVKEKGKLIAENIEGIGVANMFKGQVDYIQEAEIAQNTAIGVTYYYQICNDVTCLSPTEKKTKIIITDAGGVLDSSAAAVAATPTDSAKVANAPTLANPDSVSTSVNTTVNAPLEAEEQSLLMLFL
ncbi:MAG: hypothetical protein EBZ77_13255, partial [Chitinophagia bacterium]|nr:hypothetical protein [Chitinophagia bacterium]